MIAHAYWGVELLASALWAGAEPADAFPADVAWWARQLWPGPHQPRFELRSTADRTVLLGRVTGPDPDRARALATAARDAAMNLPGHLTGRPLESPAEVAATVRLPWPAAAEQVGIGKQVIRERAVRSDVADSYAVVQPFNAGPPPVGASTPQEILSSAPAPTMLSCLLVPTAVSGALTANLRSLAGDFDQLAQPKYVAAGLYGASRTLPPDPFAPIGAALSRDAASRYRDRAFRFRATVASSRPLDRALVEALADTVSPAVRGRTSLPVRAEYPTRQLFLAPVASVADELPQHPGSVIAQLAQLVDPGEAASLARLPVPSSQRRPGGSGRELFVSYRTVNGDSARVLKGALDAAFGPESVFFDTDSIHGGSKIGDEIHAALAVCRLILVVVDHDWLTVVDHRGRRRLTDPQDWVRREIEYGLSHPVLVVPVLWGGVPMPRRDELPRPMRGLFEWKALEVRHASATRDLDQLVADVRRALNRRASAPLATTLSG